MYRHKLALASADSSKEFKPITDFERILTQLWKFFDDSPKRTACFVKVQREVRNMDCIVSESVTRNITTKVQKACKSRWLSTNKALSALFNDLVVVLQTLNSLSEKDFVAEGFLKKLKEVKFIGILYMMKEVLPILSQLSVVFQKGSLSFSRIAPSIEHTKFMLNQIGDTPINNLKTDIAGRLKTCGFKLNTSTENDLKSLQKKYIDSLIEKY